MPVSLQQSPWLMALPRAVIRVLLLLPTVTAAAMAVETTLTTTMGTTAHRRCQCPCQCLWQLILQALRHTAPLPLLHTAPLLTVRVPQAGTMVTTITVCSNVCPSMDLDLLLLP